MLHGRKAIFYQILFEKAKLTIEESMVPVSETQRQNGIKIKLYYKRRLMPVENKVQTDFVFYFTRHS